MATYIHTYIHTHFHLFNYTSITTYIYIYLSRFRHLFYNRSVNRKTQKRKKEQLPSQTANCVSRNNPYRKLQIPFLHTVYIHICIHTYIYIYIHTYIHTFICSYIHDDCYRFCYVSSSLGWQQFVVRSQWMAEQSSIRISLSCQPNPTHWWGGEVKECV